MDANNGFFVLILGMVTVFIGLIVLIYISKLMSYIIRKLSKEEAPKAAVKPAPAAAPSAAQIPNRQQFVAVVSAAIAEYTDTDADGLRIKSIRQL